MTKPDADVAELGARVSGLEKNFGDFATKTDGQFLAMRNEQAQNFAALRQESAASLSELNRSIQGVVGTVNRGTPWGVILTGLGVGFSIMCGIGALAYSPIKESTARLELQVDRMSEKIVPRVEHERLWRQNERTIDRLITRLDRLDGRLPKESP